MKVECAWCGGQIERKRKQSGVRCPSCRKAYLAQWRADRRTEIRASFRVWAQKNAQAIRERKHAWAEKNRAKVRRQNAASARRARELDRKTIAETPCLDCGMFHDPATRERVIRRMLPAGTREIREAWPCLFAGNSGERMLLRDLRRMGAVRMVVALGALREGTYYPAETRAA